MLLGRSSAIIFATICRLALSTQLPSSLTRNHQLSPAGGKSELRHPDEDTPCLTCTMHGSEASRLYVHARLDGLGMQSTYIIYAMALAAKLGMNFAGVFDVLPQKASLMGDLAVVFGTDLTSDVPQHSVSYKWFWEIEDDVRDGNLSITGQQILLMRHWIGYGCDQAGMSFKEAGRNINDYLTADFLHKFRLTSRLPRTNVSSSNKFVAMHVRRGDVDLDHYSERFMHDDYYFQMAGRIKRISPDSEIHVFSDGGLDKAKYSDRGMIVHQWRTELEDWSWMSSADVLVLGMSSFGYIPAYLNTKCVVYTHFCGLPPLTDWILGDDPSIESKLNPCLT